MANSADSLLATNEPEITAAVNNLKSSTAALKKIMDDLQSGQGLAGTLLQNEPLANQRRKPSRTTCPSPRAI